MKLFELHEAKTPDKSWAKASISYAGNNFDNEDGSFQNLTSLAGAPKEVKGSFSCANNYLTSLANAPTKVGGNFMCGKNKLTSLKGVPSAIGRGFWCDDNKLTSLEGGLQSKFNGPFVCDFNDLTTLVGGPREVRGRFSCNANKLTSLEGAPEIVGDHFSCNSNQLTSLEGVHLQIKHIGGAGYFVNNPIRSHVLGLLLIDGLTSVTFSNGKVQRIINKYLEGSRDVIDCQNELMDAGLDEYAQL